MENRTSSLSTRAESTIQKLLMNHIKNKADLLCYFKSRAKERGAWLFHMAGLIPTCRYKCKQTVNQRLSIEGWIGLFGRILKKLKLKHLDMNIPTTHSASYWQCQQRDCISNCPSKEQKNQIWRLLFSSLQVALPLISLRQARAFQYGKTFSKRSKKHWTTTMTPRFHHQKLYSMPC